jgi:hypothetical protein
MAAVAVQSECPNTAMSVRALRFCSEILGSSSPFVLSAGSDSNMLGIDDNSFE